MKRISAPVVLGLVSALLLAGCGRGVVDAGPVGGDPDPEPDADEAPDLVDPDAEPGQPDEPPADVNDDGDAAHDVTTTAIRLYYLAPGGETHGRAGPFLASVQREIPSTQRIALATLRELVSGPAAPDRAMIDGISTAVPEQTLVLDVTIDDAVATVNLSREFESGGGSFSMFARLAQVVYTLTQFPTVDAVQFELDGQPVTVFSGEGIVLDGPVSRDEYRDLLPTVFVDTPAAGADVQSGVRVTGMAAVFEATFHYVLRGVDGTVLAEDFAMTDEGMGWGSFDFRLAFDVDEPQEGTLTVFAESAEDGSVQGERVSPLVLLP